MTHGRASAQTASHQRWCDGETSQGAREIPEETPVAFVYEGATTAVMMATPADLEDFAFGFSLTEAIVEHARDIRDLAIAESEKGIEIRLWLVAPSRARLEARRRRMAGPVGCGLCGIESLEQALRAPPRVGAEAFRLAPSELIAAMAALPAAQRLNAATQGVHAAGYWRAGEGLVALREDVGRHNALDKLAGALARHGARADDGAILLTSRVSVEMVQKSAMIGAPVIAAVSAPTALAVRTAEVAGVTLVGIARADGFEIFSHPERIRQTS